MCKIEKFTINSNTSVHFYSFYTFLFHVFVIKLIKRPSQSNAFEVKWCNIGKGPWLPYTCCIITWVTIATSTWPISAKKSSMVFIIINNRYSAIQWCFTNFREKIYSSVVKVEPIISLTELNIQQISTVMLVFIAQRGGWTEGIDSMWLCSSSIQLMSKIQKNGEKM